MRAFKFLLPIVAWVLCCGSMVVNSNRTRGIIITEAAGLAAVRACSLAVRVSDFANAAGLGYGASILLNEWQSQQAVELETLISRNGVV
ncbi:hypothetical protein [Chlamydia vaughanii]|uniref:hypothetical protein n=1 Tax=Chlamydia vaughanii TaxID=3112552 RepID=UPI0032B26DB7